MKRPTIMLIALLVLLTQCAFAQSDRNVLGTNLRLELLGGQRLQGELLAVASDSLWISTNGFVRPLSMNDLASARRRVGGPTFATHMLWAGAGGLISGLALAGACSSVDDADGCAGIVPASLMAWGLVGALTGALSGGRWRPLDVSAHSLQPYARFPQGLPPGLDPERDLGYGAWPR